MTDKKKRYTILGAGEHYWVELEPKKFGPREPPKTPTIGETRKRLAPRAQDVLRGISEMPSEARLTETVVEIRMAEHFSAKSYHPTELIKATEVVLRGTGTWTAATQARPARAKEDPKVESEPSRNRALYVSGDLSSVKKLVHAVSTGISEKVDADVVKIADIRLPESTDRLKIVPGEADRVAIELVLFDWTDRLLQQALTRLRKLFRAAGVSDNDVRIRSYDRGPTFIAAVIPQEIVVALGDLNYLRSARALPRVGLSDAIARRALGPSAPATAIANVRLPEIAVFDGGYNAGNPLLDPYVSITDLSPQPGTPRLLEHGTMVSSAAVYGPFDQSGAIPAPVCRVRHFRVLPDPLNDQLELYGVIDAIEKQVPQLGAEIAVINLSLGPEGPLDDDVPVRFTYALDRLTREHSKLFVTAAGNWGARPGQERVQPPADSVNNLAVGAYRLSSSGSPEYAHYSSRGRGRGGSVVKPDVVAFGGCAARPFWALAAPGALAGECGTSLATPVVSSLAGRIADVSAPTPLTPEALRALIVHTTRKVEGASLLEVGHGRVPVSIDEILECAPKRVSVLYQGVLSPRRGWKLPFLLPVDFQPNGNVSFSWTIALSPDVAQSAPDEYTLGGVEVGFRPHADIFRYNPPINSDTNLRIVNIVEDGPLAEELEIAGWRRSQLPVADSGAPGKDERALRATEGKWETVVRGKKTKRAGKLSEPMLTLHVQGRGDWDRKDSTLQARYAAVLTVEASKYNGDLYDEVVKLYPKIGPLTVRERARVSRAT